MLQIHAKIYCCFHNIYCVCMCASVSKYACFYITLYIDYAFITHLPS